MIIRFMKKAPDDAGALSVDEVSPVLVLRNDRPAPAIIDPHGDEIDVLADAVRPRRERDSAG
jgi:hypothetical protein